MHYEVVWENQVNYRIESIRKMVSMKLVFNKCQVLIK